MSPHPCPYELEGSLEAKCTLVADEWHLVPPIIGANDGTPISDTLVPCLTSN